MYSGHMANSPEAERSPREFLESIMKKLCSKYDPSLVYEAAKYETLDHNRRRQYDRRGKHLGHDISGMLPYPRDLLYSDHHSERQEWENMKAPREDHPSLYEKDGVRTFYSEPYTLSWKDLVETVIFCEQHGLQASISGSSAHNPGCTFTVKYHYVGTPEDS